MAAQNGYVSQNAYELYDTTGDDRGLDATTPPAASASRSRSARTPPSRTAAASTRPYAVTIEAVRGRRPERRAAATARRTSLALENAADAAKHTTLTGTAPAGVTLRAARRSSSPRPRRCEPRDRRASDENARARAASRPLQGQARHDARRAGDGSSSGHQPVDAAGRSTPSRYRTAVRARRRGRRSSRGGDLPNPRATAAEANDEDDDVHGHGRRRRGLHARRQRGAATGADDYDIDALPTRTATSPSRGRRLGATARDGDERSSIDEPEAGDYFVRVDNFAAVGPYDRHRSRLGPGPQWSSAARRRPGR